MIIITLLICNESMYKICKNKESKYEGLCVAI